MKLKYNLGTNFILNIFDIFYYNIDNEMVGELLTLSSLCWDCHLSTYNETSEKTLFEEASLIDIKNCLNARTKKL